MCCIGKWFLHSNAHEQTLMPTKIGWKSPKIDKKSREFINHFRDFLCFNGFMPENAIFRGRWCLRVRTILDLGVRCRPLRGLFSPKKFWFCNELQWGEMKCNEPHLTQGEKNSTFYSKGVVYRQKKSFSSFFCEKNHQSTNLYLQRSPILNMNIYSK